jgi:GMP synthase-like glutamine amidotransferase
LRVQIIQHSAADASAAVLPILDLLGHQVSITRLDRGDEIPGDVDHDVLMMFGGGISLTSKEPPPWVEPEKCLIRRYVDRDRRVLGICLGAQLIAAALGASVRRNREPEVGWHQVSKVDGAAETGVASSLPKSMTAFHWHQDTFEIPPGARRLFQSPATRNQAFAIGDHIFGFQFHFEANERTVRTFVAVSSLLQKEGRFVQSEAEILQGIESYLKKQNEQLREFVRTFCKT